MEEIRTQATELVAKELGINISEIDPDKDIREQINLDSMQLIAISAKIEDELKIEIPISALGVNTLNEFLNIVQKEFEAKKSKD